MNTYYNVNRGHDSTRQQAFDGICRAESRWSA